MRRIGVDVGGTFTDLIYIDDEAGQVIVHKTPSTPADPSIGTVQGIQRAVRDGRHRARPARPGLPRHDGRDQHRDRAQRRQGRDDHDQGLSRHPAHRAAQEADELLALAEPAVAGAARSCDGASGSPSTSASTRTATSSSRSTTTRCAPRCAGSSARRSRRSPSACCSRSSIPCTRSASRAIVREEFPEAFLSVSSEVIPQYREYERFSTVGPERLRRSEGLELHRALRRRPAQDEGALGHPPDDLGSGRRDARGRHGEAGQPAHVRPDCRSRRRHLDGPAVATRRTSITLDVGGTSADIGLAQDGKLRMKHLLDTKVGPYQAMIPMVDVDTIGAGGGSIAYIDAGRDLPRRPALGRSRSGPRRVRPRQAPSRPRPTP